MSTLVNKIKGWLYGESGDREVNDAREKLHTRRKRIEQLRTRNALLRADAELAALEAGGKPHTGRLDRGELGARGGLPSYRLVYAYETDKDTNFPYVPVVRYEQCELPWPAGIDPLFGFNPFPGTGYIGALAGVTAGTNSFPRELFPQFPSSIRTQIAQDAVRLESRLYFETLEFYSAPLKHIVRYAIGSGMSIDCVPRESADGEKEKAEQDGQQPTADKEKEQSPDEALAAKVSAWVENWREQFCDFDQFVSDSALNLCRDGETFTRVWDTSEEYPDVSEVDASWLRGPNNEVTGPWALGCKTSWPKRTDDCSRYNLWYPDNSQEQLTPEALIHTKNAPANQKRGIPMSFGIRVRLPQIADLISSMAVGEAERQKIAYVRQFVAADESTVRGLAFREAEHGHSKGHYGEWPGERVNPNNAATVPLINEGQMYQEGPTGGGSGQNGTLTMKTLAEVIAAALGVPVWFVMASADMENYASSLVSESPVIQTIKTIQRLVCRHFERVIRSCIRVSIANGAFPLDTLEKVKVHCELPSPVARNRVDEVNTDLALLQAGLKSPQHVCISDDLDFEEEQDLIAEAEGAGWENPVDKQLEAGTNNGNEDEPGKTGNESKPTE